MQKKGLTQIHQMIKAIKKRKANNQLIVGIPQLLVNIILGMSIFIVAYFRDIDFGIAALAACFVIFITCSQGFIYFIAYPNHIVIFFPLKCKKKLLLLKTRKIESFLFTGTASGPTFIIRLYNRSKPIRLYHSFPKKFKEKMRNYFQTHDIPESDD